MELLILLGLVAGLVLFVLFAKVLFAVLVLPFKLLFFVLGGLLHFVTGMLVTLAVFVGGAWLVGGLVFGR